MRQALGTILIRLLPTAVVKRIVVLRGLPQNVLEGCFSEIKRVYKLNS